MSSLLNLYKKPLVIIEKIDRFPALKLESFIHLKPPLRGQKGKPTNQRRQLFYVKLMID